MGTELYKYSINIKLLISEKYFPSFLFRLLVNARSPKRNVHFLAEFPFHQTPPQVKRFYEDRKFFVKTFGSVFNQLRSFRFLVLLWLRLEADNG